MLHISTFSGVGGFDLAAEWVGWTNIASCEINEFGNKVLNYYWPDAYHHDDIHTFTYEKLNTELEKRFGKNWRSDDIILSGGFPCQPYSTAGKRLGKEDERHLWPEMLRAIWEIQPKFVVAENVSGLISWNGGMVFDEVQADLEAAGYDVIPFILPACGVNAPHRRDRVWFVAKRIIIDPHNTGSGTGLGEVQEANGEIPQWNNDAEFSNAGDGITQNPNGDGRGSNEWESESGIRGFGDISTGDNERIPANDAEVGITSNPGSIELQGWVYPDRTGEAERYPGSRNTRIDKCGNWDNFPTISPICQRNDGFSNKLSGITFSKWRNEGIKALGNAVVPQVVYQIFKAIEAWDKMYK